MAQAIPIVTRADPTVGHEVLTEGYLTQPIIMADGAWGMFQGIGTLNLEGLTLKRGELTTGAYGEGYVDRRHPHSYVHELLIGAEQTRNGLEGSLFVGRGFVPFGSDDPMVRPFEKYPVDHHLAQILERPVAVAAAQYGRLIGEIGTFGGDEPTGPGAVPDYRRFGDSWATRLTLLPFAGAELSGSFADVTSPEVPAGHGLNQIKESVVARFDRSSADSWRYGLLEWAHTAEESGVVTSTSLASMLGEAAACERGVIFGLRLERSDRPEEEPLADPFRTPRPATDLSNLGVSQWTTLTGTLDAPRVSEGVFSGRPFIEIARIGVGSGNPPGLFNPILRYGTDRMWMYTIGVRLRAGSAMHDRMGRYGAALPVAETRPMSAGSMAMPGMPMPTPSRCTL